MRSNMKFDFVADWRLITSHVKTAFLRSNLLIIHFQVWIVFCLICLGLRPIVWNMYCFLYKKLSTNPILWHPCNLIWPQRWIEVYTKIRQAIIWNYFVFCVADFICFKVVARKTGIKTKMLPVIWGVQGYQLTGLVQF